MQQPQLDWDSAEPNDDASVYVPFHHTPDATWQTAIDEVLAYKNRETRDSASSGFGSVQLSPDGRGFFVENVEPGQREAMDDYLTHVLSAAQQGVEGARRRAQADAEAERERQERASRLKDEYGGG